MQHDKDNINSKANNTNESSEKVQQTKFFNKCNKNPHDRIPEW